MPVQGPSFLKSTWEGIKGGVKGLIAGSIIGTVGGAALGAAIGAFTLGAAPIAVLGALIGGISMGSFGTAAGIMTGVVRSREQGMVPAQEAMNAVKVAVVQGMAIEHQRAQAEGRWTKQVDNEVHRQASNTLTHEHAK